MKQEHVGIDLHHRRSVIVRIDEAGRDLDLPHVAQGGHPYRVAERWDFDVHRSKIEVHLLDVGRKAERALPLVR